ncbi:MAG TPA: hypothetical protein VFB92_08750 [Vicinamibacterales bacterium]|nr:hypothetical protein [Vicinamibacterales bacterium]
MGAIKASSAGRHYRSVVALQPQAAKSKSVESPEEQVELNEIIEALENIIRELKAAGATAKRRIMDGRRCRTARQRAAGAQIQQPEQKRSRKQARLEHPQSQKRPAQDWYQGSRTSNS